MLTFCAINESSFISFKEEVIKNYADKSGMFFIEGITQDIL